MPTEDLLDTLRTTLPDLYRHAIYNELRERGVRWDAVEEEAERRAVVGKRLGELEGALKGTTGGFGSSKPISVLGAFPFVHNPLKVPILREPLEPWRKLVEAMRKIEHAAG